MAALVAAAGSKKGKKGGEAITAPKFGRVKSNLKMGILGLPNVGKSSFFNLITSQSVAAENYPFCTIEPNESRCAVPDKRFDFLCDLFKPPSKISAYLSIIDIAGIIRGASEGAGLGNAFLSHIQAVDGLFHVVRAFDCPEVIHVDDSVDPIRDMETIVYELCRKDQAYLVKAKEAAAMALRKDPKKKFPDSYFTMMEKVDKMLAENMPLRNGDWTGEEVVRINESIPQCITLKPIVYLVNLDANSFKRKANKWLPKVNEWVAAHGGGTIIPMSVEWEQELWDLKQAGDEAALDAFIKGSAGVKRYQHTDLGHFLREPLPPTRAHKHTYTLTQYTHTPTHTHQHTRTQRPPAHCQGGLQRAAAHVFLHGGRHRGALLDHPRGLLRTRGCGRHPHGLRARIH